MVERTVKSGAEDTAEKTEQLLHIKKKNKQTKKHWRRSYVLSTVALLVSCVMCDAHPQEALAAFWCECQPLLCCTSLRWLSD